jgi:tRNA G26 N,N-dimethylase Trm1
MITEQKRNKSGIALEPFISHYDELYFRIKFECKFNTGNRDCYYIERNRKNNKYYLICDGWYSNESYIQEKEFNNIKDAYESLFETCENIYTYNLIYIDSNKIYEFTKKIIDELNADQYENINEIETVIESYKNTLGIDLKLVENASDKNIQIIYLSKWEKNKELKYFFVGKVIASENYIKITDENENILYLTSNSNLTIKTESIRTDYYWYFNK